MRPLFFACCGRSNKRTDSTNGETWVEGGDVTSFFESVEGFGDLRHRNRRWPNVTLWSRKSIRCGIHKGFECG